MQVEMHGACLEDEIRKRKTDGEIKAEIEAILNGNQVTILQSIEKQNRDEILREIKAIQGATQRQIARVTGLNQNIIFKA
jgi:phosphoribosylpyrophosphate synthetase